MNQLCRDLLVNRYFRLLVLFLILLLPIEPIFAASKRNAKTPVGYTAYGLQDRPFIVIDAGHGGLDIGAKSRYPFCEEKRIALTCALLAKKYLDQLGYRVILTRTSDIFIPLPRRVQIANQPRCALLVSIHFNSSKNTEAHGMEIFYCDKKMEEKRAVASRRLAEAILGDLLKRTQAKSRGVKKGNFFVIRETKVPAVLVEGGFITNPQERSLLKQREYLDKIARGVATGVDKYFKVRHAG